MKRRELLQGLVSVGIVGALSRHLFSINLTVQTSLPYSIHGSGPTVLVFDRGVGQYDGLIERYRVIVIDYPPASLSGSQDPTVIESFTPDRASADILAIADAAGADRFAIYGYSWGGVMALQLAARTNRLTALVCGGWPPLGAQYKDMATLLEKGIGQKTTNAYYRRLVDWPEEDAISKFTCPRMTFAGSKDVIVAGGITFPIGPRIAERRAKLEEMGWTVKLVDGVAHDLGLKPEAVVPLLREFLDPILLRG